jgi:predicted ferric reductase
MSTETPVRVDPEAMPPGVGLRTLIGLLLATIAGLLAALVVLPYWLPGLASSLVGSSAHGYWYLSRASAWVAFVLLWLSMAMGLLITNRLARVWPGGPTAFDLHQFVSLVALAFTVFHALILLGDHFIGYDARTLLVPFASHAYRPISVGLGQLGLYGMAVVGLSYYVRRYIGQRRWRLLHYLSFAVFLMALGHGVASGTDTSAVWAQGVYWASAGSLVFLTLYRVLAGMAQPRKVRGDHPLPVARSNEVTS